MTLSQSWSTVETASQAAINWVNEVRPGVRRLDNEANSLILELRRLKNTARRLGAVADKPITAGFFGLSQAGKSYLISSLAADDQGNLKTVFDGQELDFIKHINPPGGGKEATGLVTRFTRSEQDQIAGYPLKLSLFREIEVAKILVNAYFNDFDKERVTYQLSADKVNAALNAVKNKRSHDNIAGVSADDVVDLQDYAHDSFDKSLMVLKGNYWHQVTELAPYLPIAERATLFSLLWAEIPELTDIYIQFAQTLAQLEHASCAYAPLSAVVTQNDNGELSQANSIMNVDMLTKLNSDSDGVITIRPLVGDAVGDAVEVSLAVLTALTAELVFPLVHPTRVPAIETVDLLDFPGYRGRLALRTLDDIEELDGNPLSQLILRGKVAYLFERYTDSQEMNILLVCTPSTKQSDVNSVGPVLERWIEKTQGITPEERATRKAGLLWAITMFDMRITQDLDKPESMLQNTWGQGGLLQQTILERFGSYDWLNHWADNQPFNNVFLVRKPGFDVPFLQMDGNKELALTEARQAQMQTLHDTFVADSDIKTFVADPTAAWDAMLRLNDGGMQRISDYIKTIAHPEVKAQRLTEQLNQAIKHITQGRFETWYQQDGEAAVEQKNVIADEISTLLQQRGLFVGELLRCLELPKENIRSLYLSNDNGDQSAEDGNDDKTSSTPVNTPMGFGDGFGFGEIVNLNETATASSSQTPAPAAPIASQQQSAFAQSVFSAWINHLRELSQQARITQFFNLTAETMDKLVGELITGASRFDLESRLTQLALHNELAGHKRDELVERQVFSLFTCISDFIAWLNMIELPPNERPRSLLRNDKAIFESTFESTSGVDGLPVLSDYTANFTRSYVLDWLMAFKTLAVDNAGHSAGREITPTQNAQLGEVLRAYQQAAIGEQNVKN